LREFLPLWLQKTEYQREYEAWKKEKATTDHRTTGQRDH
jgi:hypothetical protein